MLTKDCLGVFWLIEETRFPRQHHEECDGFTIHSLWVNPPHTAQINDLLSAFSNEFQKEGFLFRPSPVFVDEYSDLCVDVKVENWEISGWKRVINSMLKAFVDAGAVVAWLAAEGAFSWPGLFEEEDLVYAAHTDDGEFFIGSDLDEEMENLGQEELRFLRSRLIERKIIEPR